MPEAIAEVQRQASGLTGQIQELSQRASDLRQMLEQQEPMLGASARQLEAYREQLTRGATLDQSDVKNLQAIQEVLQLQGGDTGRSYLSTLARIDQARTPPGRISRPLLAEEREAARDRGMTEDELERSRMMGDHTMIVRPARIKKGPVAEPGPEPESGNLDIPGPVTEPVHRVPTSERGPEPKAGFGPEGRQEPVPAVGPAAAPAPAPGPGAAAGAEDGGPTVDQPGPMTELEKLREQAARLRQEGPGADLGKLRVEASQIADAMDPELDAHRRREAQLRSSALTERQLHQEWRETSNMIGQQTKELEKAETQFDQFATYRKEGIKLSDREELTFRDLPGRIADLRAGLDQLRVEQSAIGAAGAAKGMFVDEGGQLAEPGGGGGGGMGVSRFDQMRRVGGAFVSGGGLGGGGIGTMAAGAAFGGLNPYLLLPLIAGGLLNAGRQQYSDHVSELTPFEQMGRLTGQDPDKLLLQSAGDTAKYRVFDPGAVRQTTDMLARTTGATDPDSVLATSALTGQSPMQEAMRAAQAAQFAPTLTDAHEMSLGTLAEFRRSGATTLGSSLPARLPNQGGFDPGQIAQKKSEIDLLEKLLADKQDYPGRDGYEQRLISLRQDVAGNFDRNVRGPDFDPLLYGTFADTSLRSFTGLSSSPFIPTSKRGVDAQLSAATRVPFAGIDPNSHEGIRAGGALMDSLNSFTQPSGDIFGEMQMLGVQNLRGTETAEKLKKLGIDIDNPLGVLRAMQRAPQLAQDGMPEVQRAMLDSVQQMMPDPTQRGLALALGGRDAETAYQLSRPEVGSIIGAKPAPDSDKDRLRDAALSITQGNLASAAADKIYNENIRPQINDTLMGSAVGQSMAPVLRESMNDLKEAMVDAVSTILRAEIDIPDRVRQ